MWLYPPVLRGRKRKGGAFSSLLAIFADLFAQQASLPYVICLRTRLVCELFNEMLGYGRMCFGFMLPEVKHILRRNPRMDMDGNGYLSESEIRTLLQSDAFECSYEDVDDAMGSDTTDTNILAATDI